LSHSTASAEPPVVTNVPLLDIPSNDAELLEAIQRRLASICASGRFVLGPEVEEFERRYADYCDARYCVALNSGTSALHLAIRALNIGPGDEVVTVPMTFVATAWGISYTGAMPVFVDIDPCTYTLDVGRLEAAITSRTKAILPVHLYGAPADMEAICAIADARGIAVIEDAAQAHGARYHGRRVGAIGRAGCFSFYPGKNLGAYGEAGALVTDDASFAAKVRMLRDHAQSERYRHDTIGYNYRMDAFQGAVLNTKLNRLDEWNARRRMIAERYRRRLESLPWLELPQEMSDRTSVYHQFVVALDRRDEAAARLATVGIQTGLHYPIPLHLQPAYDDLGYVRGSFPVAERLADRCLSLPISPSLSDAQIDYVCDRIQDSSP